MNAHRYVSGDTTFYAFTKSRAKPSGTTIQLRLEDWRGVASGNKVELAESNIRGAKFTKDIPEPGKGTPEPEPEKDVPVEDTAPKKKSKKSSVADQVKILANRVGYSYGNA